MGCSTQSVPLRLVRAVPGRERGGRLVQPHALNVSGAAWDDPFSSAFIGGFQLGYNLQAGHFLVGVEGDFGWATFGRPGFTVSSPLGPVQFSDRQKWISSVAARFGIVVDRWLTYGKVGGGWAQNSAAFTFPSGAPIWTDTNTHGGWLLGGGIEYGFKPNWTVKLEYDYLKLGDIEVGLLA
jgi:opacity protein-like surface antigen